MPARASLQEVCRVISTALDGAFYRAVYPDVAEGELDPIGHYAASGWREGRDPAPWFSTRAYVEAYPEIARAGWNPLHHYLVQGRLEGREVARSVEADAYLLGRARLGQEPAWSFESLAGVYQADVLAEDAARRHRERQVAATEFDAAFYLKANPDVSKVGADPLDHFLATGWKEGRDPRADFSVRDYLDNYPDISAAGINPFVHFLSAGRAEGRSCRVELGFRYDIIKALKPLEARVIAVARAQERLTLGAAAGLAKALAASGVDLSDLHVTFSHDDYTSNMGGMQLCLQRESARIAESARAHLHVFPAKPWPVVRMRGEPGALGVLLNGEPLGTFAPKTVAEALRKAAGEPGRRSFAIHSLLGHNAVETADILGAVGLTKGYFWLHDFASLCAGFHLLRNDVEDCSAPPPDSMACGVCVYGEWRARHLAEHQRLVERLSLTVVSPSQPTLDLWKASARYPAGGEILLPHATLKPRRPAPEVAADRPLRIAFAGMPSAHKGWEVFKSLVEQFAEDSRYRFIHLGGRTPKGLPLEFRRVAVTEARPRAMQEALERCEADVALIWPLCRETFSFTAYEAAAAGAAVVTGPDSGNVAAFVAETGLGRVLPDEQALAAALASGELAELARARRRPMLHDLTFSTMTAGLLEAGA